MSLNLPLSISTMLATVQPRKPKYRTTFLALFSLIVLSTYVFFISRPALALAPIRMRTGSNPVPQIPLDAEALPASRLFRLKNPQVQLTDAQELAAVSSFIASLPQNVIPSSVDPAKPIDPQLVLDFDTRSARAKQEVEHIVHDVWATNPVMLFSKTHSPLSREIKTTLASLNLRPEPTIFEVDQRDDAAVLTPLIFRLTEAQDLPVLLIGGKRVAVNDIAALRAMQESGDLQKSIQSAGAILNGGKKKKGRKH
ncbi:hypothetical protein PLICRDRAFT_103624 [Plicaturopsis crispa FD-325 SS-3]|nr:hypothetical protein PLICRDRAFT_103624 [Plicaturopsis crispa FD-325 SS-3]